LGGLPRPLGELLYFSRFIFLAAIEGKRWLDIMAYIIDRDKGIHPYLEHYGQNPKILAPIASMSF